MRTLEGGKVYTRASGRASTFGPVRHGPSGRPGTAALAVRPAPAAGHQNPIRQPARPTRAPRPAERTAGRTCYDFAMPEPTGFFHRLGDYVRTREGAPRGVWPWIRRRFLVGILVVFPLGVTILFVRFLFVFLDHWAYPITEQVFGIRIPGLGALLAVLALFLLGVLATNVVGSRLLDRFERFIGRLPLLRPIYSGARQVTEAIQLRETEQFRRVVLIPFPHAGIRSVAFVTREFRRPTTFDPDPTALVFVHHPQPDLGFSRRRFPDRRPGPSDFGRRRCQGGDFRGVARARRDAGATTARGGTPRRVTVRPTYRRLTTAAASNPESLRLSGVARM